MSVPKSALLGSSSALLGLLLLGSSSFSADESAICARFDINVLDASSALRHPDPIFLITPDDPDASLEIC